MAKPRIVPPLLASLLLGDAGRARNAAHGLSGRWAEALALAVAWRSVPRFRSRLAELEVPLSRATRTKLDAVSVAAAAQSMMIADRGAEALHRLGRAGVPAVAFKGMGTIAGLYGRASDRMIQDADILVREEDLPRAVRALEKSGFALTVSLDIERWIDLNRRLRPESLTIVFMDRDGIQLDLHCEVATSPPAHLAAARIIARSEAATLHGREFRVAAPADAILLAVNHVIRNNFAPHLAVKDLCELAALWSGEPGRWTRDAAIGTAVDCGMGAALLAAWSLLAEFDAASPAVAGIAALSAVLAEHERRDAARLAALFRLQLVSGQLDPYMLRLLNLDALRRFLLWRLRYRAEGRYFRETTGSLGLEIKPLATRLRCLLGEALSMSPRRIMTYRALIRSRRYRAVRRPP